MVHQHGLRHLERRQRHPFFQQEEDEIETVVITMPNPFTGRVQWITQEEEPKPKTKAAEATKTLNEPMVRPKPTDDDDEDKKDNKKATSTPTPSPSPSSKASSRPTQVTSHSTSQTLTSLVIDTSATPAPRVLSTSAAGTVVAAISSAAASATSSAEPAASGMSGGAKAGLALGILVAVGALLGAILFVAHRKKKQRTENQMDNEKASMHNLPPPPIAKEPTPSIRTQATAPRLSLRPVTQFDPTFEKRKSAGNMLNVAAAAGAGAAAAGNRSPSSPDAPGSPWEKRGAVNAGAPVNPFNDPQPRSVSPVSPIQDPFTNNAAIEPQASPAGPPLNFNDTPAPNVDFGNPAPAIAAAEMAPAAAILAAPPTISGEQIPPSPAWTEDIPASPGPAPSGPLPVAAVGGAAPPPSNVHRVQLDFKPSMGDELELNAGQLVRMLHEYDDGWALCVRLDRSQQGVAPRTCLSKHPVKPRQGPPRQQGPPGSPRQQGPPGQPRMRGPPGPGPNGPPMGPHGGPQQRPMSPASGRNSPHPPSLSPANGRMSPAPRSMSPGPRQMSPPQGRARSNSNAPYASQPRSMSPGPYGGGPQMAPPQQMGRPRSNSASQAGARRGPPPGPSPMNPNAPVQMPARKPIPGQAM